ncbi:5951_t:CDS:10, partial [Dentiscutata heterogama]
GQTIDMERRYGSDVIDVAKREDLNRVYQLGPKVYANCAGFIRIRPRALESFDDTRIHPTYYILARKMAADALDLDDDEAEEELQQSNRRDFLRRLSEEPDRLNDLILEDYAKSLSKYYESPTKLILHNIKTEMMNPYADPRKPFEIPPPAKIFEMIIGETDDTLYEGLIVCVKIYKIEDKALKCQLDSGLDGTITIGYVADHRIESQELRSRFHIDQQIYAKILSIDKIKFSVTLSCRPRDVNGKQTIQSQRSVDSDYDYDAEARAQSSKQVKPRNVITHKPHTRVIPHPMFKPFTFAEAQDYLRDKQPGSLVIRPSSKGHNYISITWKLYDNIYQHIDVIEEDKTGAVIGRKLLVENGKYVYSDLDELIVEYVESKAQKVEALVNHPKYKATEDILRDFLNMSLTVNPRQSEYGFCLDTKTPGWFSFMFKFKPGSQIDTWIGSIRPDGYKLKDQIYPTVVDLINGFKRNVSKNSVGFFLAKFSLKTLIDNMGSSSQSTTLSNGLNSRARSPEQRFLFINNETPIVFGVKRDVPERHTLVEKIKEHGGEVTDNFCEADFVLGDPTKTQIPTQGTDKIISYKFILDSIAAKRLRPTSSYELVISGLRSGRRHFTLQDDIDLENYLKSIPETEGLSGNEIYKQFEKINPRHSWQSWRSRALKKIVDNINVARSAQIISNVRTTNNSSTSHYADPDDLATEEMLESAINKTVENEFTDTNNQINYVEIQDTSRQTSEIVENEITDTSDQINFVEMQDTSLQTSGTVENEVTEVIDQINYAEIQGTSQQTSGILGRRRRIDEDVQEQPVAKRQRYSAVDEEFLLKIKELSEEFHVPKTEVIRLLGDTSCNFEVVRDYLNNNVIDEKYFWGNEEDAILLASTDQTQFGDILRKHG